jgi:putative Mn2+ efflux pump MntP
LSTITENSFPGNPFRVAVNQPDHHDKLSWWFFVNLEMARRAPRQAQECNAVEWYTSLLVAVGLAMDAFAVSLGVGAGGGARNPRAIFRLSFHMGLFQGLMAFLGWLAGATIAALISAVDHWIALGLLAFVGVRMIYGGLHPEDNSHQVDLSHGGPLMMVCVATSIDAMAVGLSLGVVNQSILVPSLVIGFVTLALSLAGLLLGNRLGATFGHRMEILGGLILNGIGLRILITHLF